MELLVDLLTAIPTWAWWVGGIVLVSLLFGDRVLWEYEAEFPFRQGIGRGEIELKGYKKKGCRIEVELESALLPQEVTIFLNGRRIFAIPPEQTKAARLYHTEPIALDQPAEGDEVEVHIGGEAVFQGLLVRD